MGILPDKGMSIMFKFTATSEINLHTTAFTIALWQPTTSPYAVFYSSLVNHQLTRKNIYGSHFQFYFSEGSNAAPELNWYSE